MFNKNTLHFKLNLFILSIIFLIVTIGFFIAIAIFFSIYEADVIENISTGISQFREVAIDHHKAELLSFTTGLVDQSDQLLLQKDTTTEQTLQKYIDYANTIGIEFVEISDSSTVAYKELVCDQSVLDLASQNTTINNKEPTLWVDGSAEIGLHLFCSYPIVDSNKNQIGTVLVGLPIANQTAVEYIKKTSALDATIFAGNKRIATTIMKNDVNQIGTTLDASVASTVLDQGQEYYGKSTILGEPYMVAYVPVFNSNNQPVGALFLGKSMLSIYTMRNHIVLLMSILGALLFFIFYTFSNHWLKKNVTHPIRWVADAMKTISENEYSIVENMPTAQNEKIDILQTTMLTMVAKLIAGQKKLETVAYIDSITGLPNRVFLYKKYNAASLIKEQNALSVVYYLDVDNLKYINNLFGHRVGDGLLIQMGNVLKGLLRELPEYEIYRISGDEFAICKEGYYNRDAVTNLSKLILSVFEKAFIINEQSISASVSIGISYNDSCNGTRCEICTEKCKDDLEMLLKKAELAMNRVKLNGKNDFMLFDPSMNEDIQRKASLEQDLKLAMKNKELELYYQPKFDLELNHYDGMEALVRWNHPVRGFIPPFEFIKIAEESNLIIELGTWILEKSCRFIMEYNRTHHSEYCVSVNVSTIQLLNENFEKTVLSILESTGLNPAYLELEITETVFMNSMDTAYEKLKFFKEKNINIALDDFGTGYSSLTYLKSLPITTVKLDKSFVDDIAFNAISFGIVDNVIQIARSIGLIIVVEGVETNEQLQILKSLRCHKIQGYYFSKPVPEAELPLVLSQYQ
ncbi:EAL domain-containing protein [Acetobacterium tundrae]|uniref:EAL domain-containing protein n=1 Tax=Acetobacterium tundrae TaxID=132932 RepID=A0ABR6WHB8_9FIRM|nr:EAL domain-containing protein [Acetobacterium tundrae]MBC3795860.1 EAL domain-containing protein [Acetobacterium tundrae]